MPSQGYVRVEREGPKIRVETDQLWAEICPTGEYVSGVRTLYDKRTGARDLGFGLDIVDFLLESDPLVDPAAPEEHRYPVGDEIHGNLYKSYVELPQICTRAQQLDWEIIEGSGYVAVRQGWQFTQATNGYVPGSRWEQTLVFVPGKRYFFASDRVVSANHVGDLFLRLDLPGHLQHRQGDTFEQIYLSTQGCISADQFQHNFPPDARFLYRRGVEPLPERLIRAYQIRTPDGSNPWLGALCLHPRIVSEAWCHQRGYVCFITELGRLPVNRGDMFSSAYIIGFFDSVTEMEEINDEFAGYSSLVATSQFWALTEGVGVLDEEGNLQVVPQGLGADKMTEGPWQGAAQHLDWRLMNVQEYGMDTVEKVAGENSLWLRTGGVAMVEWDTEGDTKDMGYHSSLSFALKCDRPVDWLTTQVALGDHLGNECRYNFSLAPTVEWQEVTIPLDQPVSRYGTFTLSRTSIVRFEFAAPSEYRLWLDNLRLLAPEEGRGFRTQVMS